jgi:hypothetical protein
MISRISISSAAFLGLLAGLPATHLTGQTVPSAYQFVETRQEAGPFLAYLNPGTGRFGFGPKPGVAVGARYGLHLGGPIGVEGVLTYLPTTRDLIDPGRVAGDRVVGNVSAPVVAMDARLRLSLTGDRTWKGFNPAVFGGGGFAFGFGGDDADEEILLADDRFQFTGTLEGVIGILVRWYASERILVRGDFALYLWQLKTPEGFKDPERGFAAVAEKEWVSGPSFSIGAAFHF